VKIVEHRLRQALRGREDLATAEEVEQLREQLEEEHRAEWVERTSAELRLWGRPSMILRRHLSPWAKSWLIAPMGRDRYLSLPW
jgi:hypothetical protein